MADVYRSAVKFTYFEVNIPTGSFHRIFFIGVVLNKVVKLFQVC